MTLAGLVGSQPDSWTNLKNVLKSLDEKAAEQPQHCRREDGTERKWFDTAPEAASWKAAHPKSYGSDEIMFCTRCGAFHLSHPSWAEFLPWEIPAKATVN
jgi:hypothetical protein